MTSKTADPRTVEELRQLDPDTFVPVLGMTAGQAVTEINDDAELWDAVVVPPCPSWCRMGTGHTYDSLDHDGATFLRYHDDDPWNGVGSIQQTERNREGVITLGPLTISAWAGVNDVEDLTAGEARAQAAGLLRLAERLEELAGGQR